jgi:hypothetical protein
MSKFCVRLTIIAVAIYLVTCYFLTVFANLDIWSQTYYLLFELCVCLCISKQGVYHCKYIKYTAYGILAADTLVCIDNLFDIFPVNFMVFIPPVIIIIGLSTTTTLAIHHFLRIQRLKRTWKTREQERKSRQ